MLFLSLIFCLFLYNGCYESSVTPRPEPNQTIGDKELYSFSSDDQFFLSNAQPYVLPSNTSIEEALTSLGKHLSRSYFSHSLTDRESEIRFEVVGLYNIPVKPAPLRIAIINMIDRDRYALNHFFQGSTGGQTTFAMIGATFIQPHLNPPLLDGLIILYNGDSLPELDHINLSGILTPRLVRYVAKRAIYNTRIEAIGAVEKQHGIKRYGL
jgi:hypothetical protein